MESSYSSYYYNLIPPSSFIREFHQMMWVFLALSVGLGVIADTPILESVFWKATTLDILALDALIAVVSFGVLFGVSLSRLVRYRNRARSVPTRVYALAIPWMVGLGVAVTLLFVAAMNANGRQYSFVKILGAEIAPLVIYELPFVRRWIERMVSERYWMLFRSGLPVMLGPLLGDHLDDHARDVLEFQNKYVPSLHPRTLDDEFTYTDANTLAVFQGSLSCIYETAWYLGRSLSKRFSNQVWSMTDIGGGEGIFTCEMLDTSTTLPAAVYVVEPSVENLEGYRALMTRRHPSISTVEPYPAGVEDILDALPSSDLYLASHSLYKVCDHHVPARTIRVIDRLVTKSSSGLCVIILASHYSQAYNVKRTVRQTLLKREDRSSFGEDILGLMPAEYHARSELRDSFMDLTGLLDDSDLMLAWLSYFCRIDVQQLRSHIPELKKIMTDQTTRKGELPEFTQTWIDGVAGKTNRKIVATTPILFHKEMIITLSKDG